MSCAVGSTWPSGGRRSTNRPSSDESDESHEPDAASTVGEVRAAARDELRRQRTVHQPRAASQPVTAPRERPGGAGAATGSDSVTVVRGGSWSIMGRMPRNRVLTPLRWSDMDAYGHVNNVQFLRLLEDARVVAFAAAGSDEGGSVVETGLLVARSQIEYLQPLVYRTAPVAIDLWLTDLQGASFDLGYEVLDDDPSNAGRVYARAETTLVLFDRVNDRPRRMTPSERERLEAWRDAPVRWRHRRADAVSGHRCAHRADVPRAARRPRPSTTSRPSSAGPAASTPTGPAGSSPPEAVLAVYVSPVHGGGGPTVLGLRVPRSRRRPTSTSPSSWPPCSTGSRAFPRTGTALSSRSTPPPP